MKNLAKTVGYAIAISAGYSAGKSLWNNVLEEKVSNGFKTLKKKHEEVKKEKEKEHYATVEVFENK